MDVVPSAHRRLLLNKKEIKRKQRTIGAKKETEDYWSFPDMNAPKKETEDYWSFPDMNALGSF